MAEEESDAPEALENDDDSIVVTAAKKRAVSYHTLWRLDNSYRIGKDKDRRDGGGASSTIRICM